MSKTSTSALVLALALGLGTAAHAEMGEAVSAPYLLTDQVTTTARAPVVQAPRTPVLSQPAQSDYAAQSSWSSSSSSASSATSSSTYSASTSAWTASPPPQLSPEPSYVATPGPAPVGTVCPTGVRVPGVPCHGEWVVLDGRPVPAPAQVIEQSYASSETIVAYNDANAEEVSLPLSFFTGGIRYGTGYESTVGYGGGGSTVVFFGGGGRTFSGVRNYVHIPNPPPKPRPRPPMGGCHSCH